MASVIITLKLMPTSPEVDLDKLFDDAVKHINAFIDEKHKNGEMRKEIEPIGYGLKALKIIFVMDEAQGGTEALEETLAKIADVESVEVTDVRRALG